MDWSLGSYEQVGVQLRPAAEAVVAAAQIRSGDSVVDVGCGDGNAALVAAARGAHVTGVDPAVRLLEVARTRAAAAGVDATFVEGAAGSMPLPDGSADAIVSVFGVVFAPDAVAAAHELARVASPRGRIVLSAWRPYGPLAEIVRLRVEAVARATGVAPAPGPARVAWFEADVLRELFGPHGFEVHTVDAQLPFTATSSEDFVETEFRHHPIWLETAQLIGPAATADLRRESAAVVAAANEDPSALRMTSDYVIATLSRGG
jgi:SAM-dependent methyltransferase